VTTAGQSDEPRARRARLGSELRQARRLSGLSGAELGDRLGVSQKTVSRWERGEAVPSAPQVTAWARVTKASADRRAVLLALLDSAVTEVTTYRDRLARGLAAVQDSIREREESSRAVRNFQPGIIPGLLQTAEYARRILTFANINGEDDLGPAIAARLARQPILHESGRAFEFLMTEAALRYRPGSREMLTAQLDHLAAVVTLPAISFGVIPADAEMHEIIDSAFILYEDRDDDLEPFAAVEAPHGEVIVHGPAVQAYRDKLARFRESAVYGAEALDIVRAIAHS
jgi:transcriptional regulator with XRE-family HTH domain